MEKNEVDDMLSKRKWLLLFAMLCLGLVLKMAAPEELVKSANAQTLRMDAGVRIGMADFADAVETSDIWEQAYTKLKTETPITGELIAKLALAEVREQDLELMTSSTDRVVTYHGERFAITEEDYDILLRIVEAEAGGEDIIGKLLVANVVLNRREIGFGGDTIVEVVFKKNQFSPVTSGRIFRVTPSEETIEAVKRALNGEDQSRGALYFMSRTGSSKKGIRWFESSLKFLFKYGGHEFYTEK